MAWSVCLCVWHPGELCKKKTAEPIEMPFGKLIHGNRRNHVLDEGHDRTNAFAAARGDRKAMRPFVICSNRPHRLMHAGDLASKCSLFRL